MRALLLVCLLFAGQAWGATKWCSQSGSGTADGSSAANACAFTTANVLTAFGGSLTRGDTLYICGELSGSAVWSPGGVGGASGYFTVSGNATDSGCTAGGWNMSNTGGVPINIGGGGRNFIKLYSFYVRNCASHCMTLGGNDNWVDSVTFSTADDNHIRVTVAAQRLLVTRSSFSGWGDDSSTAEAAINIEPADGVTVATVKIGGSADNANTFVGNGTARYGVSCYPAGTLHNGVASGCEVSYNTFTGSYSNAAINISRDADDARILYNDLSGVVSGGGSVVHVGGQQSYGACPTTTSGVLIQGNVVTGGSVNAINPADGSGIFPDECSDNTRVFYNVSYGNAVAGLILNDADNVTAAGNVFFGNGDNEVHVHGAGINFVAKANSSYHTADNPSGVADQGVDGWQIDATVGTGTTLTDNIMACSSNVPFCVDAGVALSSETYNDIYHPDAAKRASGFTPDATDLDDEPAWVGGSAPDSAEDFCLKATSPLLGAGTYLGAYVVGYNNEGLGKPPAIGARGQCLGRAPAASRAATPGRAETLP